MYNYNSLQTSVRHQLSRGFGIQGSYTFSKNISNVGFNSANLNNPNDMDQQYGQTPYSRPHRFFVGYHYELPFKSSGAFKRVVQGWGLSGSTLVQSGNPLTFFDGRQDRQLLAETPAAGVVAPPWAEPVRPEQNILRSDAPHRAFVAVARELWRREAFPPAGIDLNAADPNVASFRLTD